MNHEDALRKLPEYTDGGLSSEERQAISEMISVDAELREAFQVGERLESLLRGQSWLEPSPNFTPQLLSKISVATVPRKTFWLRYWEPVATWVPAAAVILMLVLHGSSLASWTFNLLSLAGIRLDGWTGLTVFALHPAILIGLMAPVLAGGLATCVLTGRCRLNP
jgi:hypothetical protein